MTTSATATSWKDTHLWALLSTNRDEHSVATCARLEIVMPDIETILESGGTGPLDFTLHDANHSFRVAERMFSLMPSDVPSALTSDEQALLLLAAYTHDIGMTPEFGRVQRLHTYLLNGAVELLSEAERAELQRWLDNNFDGVEPPIAVPGEATAEVLAKVNMLSTYFCRDQHVRWGEDWIRTNLQDNIGSYRGFVDDLILLVRSHHEGYAELASDAFQPRILGDGPRLVNLRYLAVLLRVADVLEFDPERTPDVILRHRAIGAESEIFWHKDHYIALVQEENRLVLEGRPPNALIEQAIRETAAQVEHELQLARRLADQVHFEIVPGLAQGAPHRWTIAGTLHQIITPLDDSYEFIDGAFRPDTERLLALLAGEQLYGTPFAALRELLQNAFDAVRDQIAWERLQMPDPLDRQTSDAIASTHSIELRLETASDGVWLTCQDTGIGMTKTLITDRLLVSGSGPRHDVRDLERRCAAAGFSTGRTGTFGIGVISYFMLADRVEIVTRRSQEAGDVESHGWHFKTEGIGSFGELRRDSSISRGTEVRLHIRKEVLNGVSPEKFYGDVRSFLTDTVTHVPCAVRFHSALPSTEEWLAAGGWTSSESDWASILKKQVFRDDYSYREEIPFEQLSAKRQQELEKTEHERRERETEILDSIEWIGREGDLPGGFGRYRVHIPVFSLDGGNSLVYLRISAAGKKRILKRIGTGLAFYPGGHQRISWKGMTVGVSRRLEDTLIIGLDERYFPAKAITEIDWTSSKAGLVSVDRRSVDLSDGALGALEWLQKEVLESFAEFITESNQSSYNWISARHARIDIDPDCPMEWVVAPPGNVFERLAEYDWKPVRFPAVPSVAFTYEREVGDYLWKRRKVNVIPSIASVREDDHWDGLSWSGPSLSPDRIVWREYYQPSLVPLWLDDPRKNRNRSPAGLVAEFPPEWRDMLCGVRFANFFSSYGTAVVWNADHPVVKAVDQDSQAWASTVFRGSLDPVPVSREIVSNPARAAAWLMRCLAYQAWELWEGIEERGPGFLGAVGEMLLGTPFDHQEERGARAAMWHEVAVSRERGLDLLAVNTWHFVQAQFPENEELLEHLKEPALTEWKLRRAGEAPSS